MLSSLCIKLIRFYQKNISPLKTHRTCRFMPTCSEYAVEAFREWGFFAGLGLSLWRILRCNPLCRAGYDPVPKRKRKTATEKGEVIDKDTNEE